MHRYITTPLGSPLGDRVEIPLIGSDSCQSFTFSTVLIGVSVGDGMW